MPWGLEELIEDLEALGDKKLDALAKELKKEMEKGGGRPESEKYEKGTVDPELLKAVRARLKKMMAKVIKENMLQSVDDNVPDEYSKLVEQYFKALSDEIEEDD